MRTTIDIDDDLLQFAKDRARQSGRTVSAVICDLLRDAATPRRAGRTRNGIPLFQPRPGAPKVTVEWVQRAVDDRTRLI